MNYELIFMCGIVGYIGNRVAKPILVEGIKRLEYRGYDSAGIALIENNTLESEVSVGRITALEEKISGRFSKGTYGIVHTRWATHGAPTLENAHPLIDCNNSIAVVHNGIIENHDLLKAQLEKEGHVFRSETDTEVLSHLIEKYFNPPKADLEYAVGKALKSARGTYGIAVISSRDPNKIVAARRGSPLAIGIGQEEYFITSDITAMLQHTKKVIYLDDNEMAVLTRDNLSIMTFDSIPIHKKIEEILWDAEMIEKGGYNHFMLKEIHEQPESLRNAMMERLDDISGCVRLKELMGKHEVLRNTKRIVIVACGTSWHSALIGEYMIEDLSRIPTEVEYASEFRYRNPVIEAGTVVIAISQSGETADTLAALREAKRRGAMTIAICNVVGSTLARESDAAVYLHAGPEIGVASTKAFTSQIAVLYLLTIFLGSLKNVSTAKNIEMVSELKKLPDLVQKILGKEAEIYELAKLYSNNSNFIYLGRGYNFPVALEGALKLKEISYIHAEGYPAAEMKHGPIALIDRNMPVVFIATKDSTYEKILSNIQEVRARGGKVIAIASEGDSMIQKKVDHVFYIPNTLEVLTPILSVIPLQLLAYHMAVIRGCDVDKPRNLAKSVTVE
ncbi:MAG: glutamine--fructose-6-phosphate transaminase (isomerizing) [Candidatus Brocadiales bacterium]|nr:glutamine--fructose-6-phosphate transaminase (isomerizing) [Candidatus Brocadiales bacterium]